MTPSPGQRIRPVANIARRDRLGERRTGGRVPTGIGGSMSAPRRLRSKVEDHRAARIRNAPVTERP